MIKIRSFLFRVVCILFVLLMIPFPLFVIPHMEWSYEWWTELHQQLIPWIAEHVLHLEEPITVFPRGSGDTTYNYVEVLYFLVVAVIGALIWTVLSKKEFSDDKIYYWWRTYIRYFLGFMMLNYGMMKVLQIQFPMPTYYRLLEPYGDSSPMGLAWTFLGYSKGYNLFMGLAEVIGGLLVLHRRTTTLGALVLVPVTANIVAVNFFFDVPVKLLSTQLLIVSIILLIPDLKRVMNVVVLNKLVAPRDRMGPVFKKKFRLGKEAFKWIFVAFMVITEITGAIESNNAYGANAPKPDLFGLYETELFVSNRDTIAPLIDDTKRWRYMALERVGSVQVYGMNKTRGYYKCEIDTLEKRIRFISYRDSTKISHFVYSKTDSTMVMDGVHKDDTLHITSRLRKYEDFILRNRPFRWIQEYPENR